MKLYEFTLNFALNDSNAEPESFVDRLMEAGCDDALVGIGRRGQVALDFSREADSAEEAVLSALSDVKRAIPDAEFAEAAPDFVGVPDIAKILGVSRQYVGKVLDRHDRDFPVPAHAGTRAMWHLATVLTWLTERNLRDIDAGLIELSRVNMRCNLARELNRPEGGVPDRYRKAIG